MTPRYIASPRKNEPLLHGVYCRQCKRMILDGYYLFPQHAERVAKHLNTWSVACPHCDGATLVMPNTVGGNHNGAGGQVGGQTTRARYGVEHYRAMGLNGKFVQMANRQRDSEIA